jgi:hypothetical protein
MKRKLLIVITGFALLFILALAGCTSPIADHFTLDGTEKPYSISGPASVTARAYEGIVLLTWDPVPDATGYQIFRKDDTDNISKAIDNGRYDHDNDPLTPDIRKPFDKQEQLYFIDKATFDNNLINGHSYTYTVYSLSGQSGNQRAATLDAYIGNGKTDSNTVTANVPDRSAGSFGWIAIDPASIKIEPLVNSVTNSQSDFLVSWDAKPNLNYSVSYSYGKGTTIGGTSDFPILPIINYYSAYTGYSPLNPKAYVKIPIVGGENSISIGAYFVGGTEYYSKVDIKTKTETLAQSGISAPNNFSATRNNTTVAFKWDDVEEAVSYAVYKAPYDKAAEAITGDWTPVATTPEKVYYYPNWSWIASERNVAIDKSYYYAVIAIAGNTKSRASTAAIVEQEVISAITPTAKLLEGSAGQKVQITWERAPFDTGVTYELHRAVFEVDGNDGNGLWQSYYNWNNVTKLESWTAIPVNPSQYLQTKGVVVDTTALANTYYIYRLVVKKGALASDPGYAIMAEEGAFIKANYYALAVAEDTDPRNLHGAVALVLRNGYGFDAYGVGSVELYKRKYNNGNPQEPYTLVSNSLFNNTVTPQYWIDRGVEIGTQYQYRIVVKYANGTPFVDPDQNYVEITASPKVASVYSVNVSTTTSSTVTLGFLGTNLREAPLTIRYRVAPAANWTPVANPSISWKEVSGTYEYTITGLTAGTSYEIEVTPYGQTTETLSATTP